MTHSGKSRKVAFIPRNGGFLFPECWLFKNGIGDFFVRIMQLDVDFLVQFNIPEFNGFLTFRCRMNKQFHSLER